MGITRSPPVKHTMKCSRGNPSTNFWKQPYVCLLMRTSILRVLSLGRSHTTVDLYMTQAQWCDPSMAHKPLNPKTLSYIANLGVLYQTFPPTVMTQAQWCDASMAHKPLNPKPESYIANLGVLYQTFPPTVSPLKMPQRHSSLQLQGSR